MLEEKPVDRMHKQRVTSVKYPGKMVSTRVGSSN